MVVKERLLGIENAIAAMFEAGVEEEVVIQKWIQDVLRRIESLSGI